MFGGWFSDLLIMWYYRLYRGLRCLIRQAGVAGVSLPEGLRLPTMLSQKAGSADQSSPALLPLAACCPPYSRSSSLSQVQSHLPVCHTVTTLPNRATSPRGCLRNVSSYDICFRLILIMWKFTLVTTSMLCHASTEYKVAVMFQHFGQGLSIKHMPKTTTNSQNR